MWDFSVSLVATYGCTNSTWDIQDNNLSSRSLAKTEQANDQQAPNQDLKDLLAWWWWCLEGDCSQLYDPYRRPGGKLSVDTDV